MTVTIGFIGVGNMGGALACAAAAGGANVLLANRTERKAIDLAAKIGGTVCSNEQISRTADYIFLGVKPQQYPELLSELSATLAARTDRFVLVSMAAGVRIESVRQMAGGQYPIVRIMPNLPVQVGEGMVIYCSDGVDGGQLDNLLGAMKQAGTWDSVDENLIDAGSALSGCGPAFVYMFIDALTEGAVKCGLPREKAVQYAIMTVKGAAALASMSDKTPAMLCDAVCSPAGSTIEGVKSLRNDRFDDTVMAAVEASYKRTVELGK